MYAGTGICFKMHSHGVRRLEYMDFESSEFIESSFIPDELLVRRRAVTM